jgi:hypothetical protein
MGGAFSAASLVKEHDAPSLRIEVASIDGIDPSARPTVQKYHGLSLWITGLLDLKFVDLVYLDSETIERLDWGVEWSQPLRK